MPTRVRFSQLAAGSKGLLYNARWRLSFSYQNDILLCPPPHAHRPVRACKPYILIYMHVIQCRVVGIYSRKAAI
jgi:hypothetical protein